MLSDDKDVTIQDIAKLAGVSIATVSYVLNNKKKVSPEVRQRVLNLVETLGYRINTHAKNLRKKNSQQEIQVFLPSLQGLFFSEIISGIENYISDNTQYILNFSCNLTSSYPLENSASQGFIVFYTSIQDKEIEKCLNLPHPRAISLIDRQLSPDYADRYTSLNFDNYCGAQLACQYLYEKYGKDICLIAGPSDSPDSIIRSQGYADFMGKTAAAHIHTANFITKTAYELACHLAEVGPLARSYFCANDEMAYGFLRAFQEHGLRIPEDVAVMGFDDVFYSQHCIPPLTTIRQPIAEMGVAAAELLIKQLRYETIAERHLVFGPQLVIRSSA